MIPIKPREKTKTDDPNINAVEFQEGLKLIRAFNDGLLET
jgi:hypothetical protein